MRSDLTSLETLGPALRGAGLLVPLLLVLVGCRAATDEPAAPAGSGDVPVTVPIGDVEWYVDYDAAVAVARRRDVPLWVHFGENPG